MLGTCGVRGYGDLWIDWCIGEVVFIRVLEEWCLWCCEVRAGARGGAAGVTWCNQIWSPVIW